MMVMGVKGRDEVVMMGSEGRVEMGREEESDGRKQGEEKDWVCRGEEEVRNGSDGREGER